MFDKCFSRIYDMVHRRKTLVFGLLLALALVLLPVNSWALSSDREQPMLIEADRAELDDANGISIYRGNVKVTQGTLVLTGDIMTVYTKGNDVVKVIMEGQPATYSQRPDNKDKDGRASALHMEYFTNPEKIILTGQAEVEQQGDVLRSERIEYDVPTDKVQAGTEQPDERVRSTMQPRKEKEKKTPAKP